MDAPSNNKFVKFVIVQIVWRSFGCVRACAMCIYLRASVGDEIRWLLFGHLKCTNTRSRTHAYTIKTHFIGRWMNFSIFKSCSANS